MTATLISLLSILVGIFATNAVGWFIPRFSLGLIGNTIAGVFGSILFIKIFGRFGFDPATIVSSSDYSTALLLLNLLTSGLGGVCGLVMVRYLKK